MSSVAGLLRLPSQRIIQLAGALALLALTSVHAIERTLTHELQRFDEGILLNSVSFLTQGVVPVGDAYQPYGPAYGLPALPGQIVFGTEALITRVPYSLAPAIVVALAFYWLYPRAGFWTAAGVAVLVSMADVPRYSLPWICVFCFLIAMDRTIRRSSAPTLDAALTEHAPAVVVAGGLLAIAAWFRMEYGMFVVVWIATMLVVTRRQPRPAVVLVPLAVALAPIVLVIAAGGLRHFVWWLEYAVSGFREFRSQPFNASAPLDFARLIFGGENRTEFAMQTFSYFAGGVIVAATALNALFAKRWRFINRDPTGLSMFLIVIGAIVLYAQSVRFFGAQGYQAMPLLWPAFAALPFRWAGVRPLVIAAVLVVLAPMVAERFNIRGQLRHASIVYQQTGSFQSVPGLRRMPLNDEQKVTLRALRSLWERQLPMPTHTFVINRRNDDAQANEAFVYWFLDVRPSAWPTTYDPGLADRADVQREAVDDLCANPSPLIQGVGSYLGARPQSRSDVLDQFVALNYDVVGGTPLYRILRPRSNPCLRPEEATTADLRGRRDALLKRNELPEAGTVSEALVAREQAAGRPAASGDLALAALGGRLVNARVAQDETVRRLVTALAVGDRSFPYVRLSADRLADPLVRLAAILGHVRNGRQPLRPAVDARVADAALALAASKPRYAPLGEAITGIVPPGPAVFSRLRREGTRAEWLMRWQFDYAASAKDRKTVSLLGRKLIEATPVRPLERASVFASLAGLSGRSIDIKCGQVLSAVGEALRGVDPQRAVTPERCRSSVLRRLVRLGARAARSPIPWTSAR